MEGGTNFETHCLLQVNNNLTAVTLVARLHAGPDLPYALRHSIRSSTLWALSTLGPHAWLVIATKVGRRQFFWSTPLFDRIMQRKSVEDLTLSVSSLLSKKCQRPRATESRPWSNAHFSGRFLATVPVFCWVIQKSAESRKNRVNRRVNESPTEQWRHSRLAQY